MELMSHLVTFVLRESVNLDSSSVKMVEAVLLQHSCVMDKMTAVMGELHTYTVVILPNLHVLFSLGS